MATTTTVATPAAGQSVPKLQYEKITLPNGLAIGGGVVLLSCCDLRLAAESAWFSINAQGRSSLPTSW